MKFVPVFVILMIFFLMCGGLVNDMLGKGQTLQQSLTIAQSAARAGTNAATGNSINGDALDISAPMAVTAAKNYLDTAGVEGEVSVAGDTVTVTVHMTYQPTMLGPVPLPLIPVQATGSARLIGN